MSDTLLLSLSLWFFLLPLSLFLFFPPSLLFSPSLSSLLSSLFYLPVSLLSLCLHYSLLFLAYHSHVFVFPIVVSLTPSHPLPFNVSLSQHFSVGLSMPLLPILFRQLVLLLPGVMIFQPTVCSMARVPSHRPPPSMRSWQKYIKSAFHTVVYYRAFGSHFVLYYKQYGLRLSLRSYPDKTA